MIGVNLLYRKVLRQNQTQTLVTFLMLGQKSSCNETAFNCSSVNHQQKFPGRNLPLTSGLVVPPKLLPMSLLRILTMSIITTIADLPEPDMEAYHQQSSRVHFGRQSQSSSQHLRMSCMMTTTNHTPGMESAHAKIHRSCLSHRFLHPPPLTQIF